MFHLGRVENFKDATRTPNPHANESKKRKKKRAENEIRTRRCRFSYRNTECLCFAILLFGLLLSSASHAHQRGFTLTGVCSQTERGRTRKNKRKHASNKKQNALSRSPVSEGERHKRPRRMKRQAVTIVPCMHREISTRQEPRGVTSERIQKKTKNKQGKSKIRSLLPFPATSCIHKTDKTSSRCS